MYRVCTCSTQQMHKTPVLWKNVTQPQSVHDSPPPSPYTLTPSPCRKQRYRHARSQVDQYWKLTADKPTSDYPMKLSSPGTIRLAPPPPFPRDNWPRVDHSPLSPTKDYSSDTNNCIPVVVHKAQTKSCMTRFRTLGRKREQS